MSSSLTTLPSPVAVAENRCSFRVVSSASYRYDVPAYSVVTQLRLVPPDVRGLQRLIRYDLQSAPLPYSQPESDDLLGNRVIELRHEEVQEHLTLIVDIRVETAARYDADGAIVPSPIPSTDVARDTDRYRLVTPRTRPSDDMERFAATLRRDFDPAIDGIGFATALRSRIHDRMVFRTGSTHVGTPAAEAWAGRRGVCQDFAQITLSISRLCGVPARYVSGFVPGEGVMHAWVEVLLSRDAGSPPEWYALDPTYDKWVDERYISVASGRDFADITPTSGSYFGGANTLRYGTRVVMLDKSLVLL